MSGGSGPISKQCAERLQQSERAVALDEQSGTMEIFKNLSMNRVVYFPTHQSVYFVASEHFDILGIIEAVFGGLKKTFKVEQLFLDEHGFFRGPLRLVVNEAEARSLLVALRLNQISVCVPCKVAVYGRR